jgi:hypothetical protein
MVGISVPWVELKMIRGSQVDHGPDARSGFLCLFQTVEDRFSGDQAQTATEREQRKDC